MIGLTIIVIVFCAIDIVGCSLRTVHRLYLFVFEGGISMRPWLRLVKKRGITVI